VQRRIGKALPLAEYDTVVDVLCLIKCLIFTLLQLSIYTSPSNKSISQSIAKYVKLSSC